MDPEEEGEEVDRDLRLLQGFKARLDFKGKQDRERQQEYKHRGLEQRGTYLKV